MGRALMLWLLLGAVVAGCASPPPPRPSGPVEPVEDEISPEMGEDPAELRLGPEPVRIPPPYRLKSGDVLQISVIGDEAETDQTVPVGPDGRIQYMTVRDLYAAGKTIQELATELEDRLREIYRSPRVSLIAKSYSGNSVTINGMVRDPGRYTITSNSKLMDVIAMAGGIPLINPTLGTDALELADLENAYVLRENRVLDVDFEALFSDTPAEVVRNNVVLLPDDTVYIPSAVRLENKIIVVGEVRAPGLYRFKKSIHLAEAIALARGVTVRGWERKAWIVRGSLENPEVESVDVRAVMEGRMPSPLLSSNDIIYIPTTPLGKAAEVSEQLRPVLDSVEITDRVFQRYR